MTVTGSPSSTVGLQTVFNTLLLQQIVLFYKNIFLWQISSEPGRVLGLL